MNTSESFQALRRANPRAKAGFTESVDAAADAVRAQLVTTTADLASDGARQGDTAGVPIHGVVSRAPPRSPCPWRPRRPWPRS